MDGQEATVRTGHGITDWFQIGKGVRQSCILSPCLFNFYAEYIMRNAGLEETQAGIKIAGRNINHLRYADDTTLMAESEEELKSLLMKVKEESEKVGLKLDIQKTNIMASAPITSWEIDGETVETIIVGDFNTPLTPMYRSSKQKINKETQVLNDTLDEMDLTDIFRTFHLNAEENTFFSSVHGTFSRTDHILVHKSNLSKFKKTEIVSSIFSNHNAMRLDIKYRK